MKRALEVLLFTAFSAATLPALAQHTATINQQGSSGTATIDQVIGIAPFEANIVQGPGVGSRARIQQSGVDAQATINQSADRQSALVLQAVDGGHVTVSQGGGSGNSTSIDERGV